MIEIFDRVLQLLEHVLLALAVARDVGDRPHRIFGVALALPEGTHAHAQPAAMRTVAIGDAHLFLLPLALARRFQQPEHRLRYIRVADEDTLDRPHVLRAGRAGECEIGAVEIHHMPARIRHRQPVEGVIGDVAHHGIVGLAVGKADDAGGKGEQVEQPDHGEHGKKAKDIGLRLVAPDGHQPDRDRHQPPRDQQHQHDRAAPPQRLMHSHRLGRRIEVDMGVHGGESGPPVVHANC